MAIQGLTLGTQRGLTNDMLIKGIIDSVVTVNQFYQMLPFKGIQGNALAYNREERGTDQTGLVDVLRTGVSGINKDQQRFSRHSTELTTIIGDAQVNGLIQAVGSDYNDATAVQVAAKAKGIGRRYMELLINGQENAAGLTTGTSNPQMLTGTPTLTDTSDVTVDDFVRTVLSGVAHNRNNVTYDLSGTGANGRAVTLANFRADLDGRGANDSITALVIDGQGFTLGPGSSALTSNGGTGAGSDSLVLTANGVAVYNAALRVAYGNLGFDGLARFASEAGRDGSTGGGTDAGDRLEYLDELIDGIHDKDGMVDYIMMNSRGVRKITQDFRAVGTGFDMMDVKMSSGGIMQVQSYRGVPIFRNDFVGTSGGLSSDRAGVSGGDLGAATTGRDDIYVGTLDDGSFSHGICGLTAQNAAGMQVQKLGAREDVDADITRVKWYCGLAHFSELGLIRGEMA